ncbi:MAG: hypothetical protein PHO02_01885 [Candidatus Nanoarchaeia archaeon]|nr:hypothetical protein [Candidatus Nanoarchaeia archaeon]
MKKLGLFIVVLLLMSSFASAGFWDLITGKVVDAEKVNLNLCTPKITPDATTAALGKNVFVQDYNRFSGTGITRLPENQVLVGVSATTHYEMEGQEVMLEGETKDIAGLRIKVADVYMPSGNYARRCARLEVSRTPESVVVQGVAVDNDAGMMMANPQLNLQAQPAKPSLIARIFGTKTVTRAPPLTNVPGGAAAATNKPGSSTEVDPGAVGIASVPTVDAGRAAGVLKECKPIDVMEGGKNGNEICRGNGFPLCLTVLQEFSTKHYGSKDATCKGLQYHTRSSRLLLCNEAITEPFDDGCYTGRDAEPSLEPITGDMTALRSYQVLCCK